DFEAERPPGEMPCPFKLTAIEVRTGHRLCVGLDDLSKQGPPYPLGSESLFVAYDAPHALGCHLSLGWPMPERVLDLHREFRCMKSGIIPSGDYAIADALTHLGAQSQDQDCLRAIYDHLAPRIDLPRALVRGRYGAAVARMESVGVPVDVEGLM